MAASGVLRSGAWRPVLVAGWPVLLTMVLCRPLFAAGYPLGRDMVFVPHQALTASSLGAGSASPRAVPLDAIVELLSLGADGGLVGRVLVVAVLPIAAWGCLAVAGHRGLPASLLVGGLTVWNPFVVERMALGQWALLYAYAALPWIVVAARRVRSAGGLANWSLLALAVAASSITPTGAVIGGVSAVALVAGRRPRTVGVGVLALAVQLPWLLAAALGSASAVSDPAAVSAFAARAERGGGAVLSLLGLGGVWDRTATPGSRSGTLGYLSTALVIAVLLVVLVPAVRRRRWTSGMVSVRLAWLGAAGFLAAATSTLPGGAFLVRTAVAHVPGAGLWRDGQKWLIPFVTVVILLAGELFDRLSSLLLARSTEAVVVAGIAGLTVPLLLLPDGGATVRPTLTPAHYPGAWTTARRLIDADPGTVLALPFSSYRSFAWVTASSVIDPVPRWLSEPVITDDRLVVGGRRLAGEDPRAARIAQLLDRDADDPAGLRRDLAAEGVGWVFLERDGGGEQPTATSLAALTPVHLDAAVGLYRVSDPAPDRPSALRTAVLVIVDCVLAGLVAICLVIVTVTGVRRCYTRR